MCVIVAKGLFQVVFYEDILVSTGIDALRNIGNTAQTVLHLLTHDCFPVEDLEYHVVGLRSAMSLVRLVCVKMNYKISENYCGVGKILIDFILL